MKGNPSSMCFWPRSCSFKLQESLPREGNSPGLSLGIDLGLIPAPDLINIQLHLFGLDGAAPDLRL
jgi:hypothetical protein